jgi:methyltransferase (TIGR00027 family)
MCPAEARLRSVTVLVAITALAVLSPNAFAVEPGMPSETSMQTMIARALGSHDPDPSVRNPDWLAERFVGPAERAALAGTVFETALDLDWRQAVTIPELERFVRVHLMRTRFIDEKVVKALKGGAKQVVILGAGFDSRAYRFRTQFPAVRFFEVDFGPTQEYKKKRVTEVFGGLPSNVAYAPIDFTKEKLGDVLTRAGYRAAERTLFIWEGVAYYLPASAVLDTLRYIAINSPPGSTLTMDAVYQFLIDKASKEPDPTDPPDVRAIVAMTRRLAQTGEPWLSGIPENREREYLAQAGLNVVEVLPMGSAEAARRYRTRRDGTIVGNSASFPSVGCLLEATVPPRRSE